MAAPLLPAPAPAGAKPVDAAPTAAAAAVGAAPLALEKPTTVTLITGDKVTVQPDGVVAVEHAPGREHVSFQQADGGLDRIRVVPWDAAQLVAEGKLDGRLFDVSYLIREGYDDASRSDVPLLVDGQASAVRAVASASRAAGSRAKVTRELPRVGMSVVAQDKQTATKLWGQLTGHAAQSKASKSPSKAARAVLPAGVQRVWLDGKARITLDRSVPQVGAPAAWQAGFDGTGTTVAVLDSGIDVTHPDLAGKVTAERNFTIEPTPADGHGHGTHVASTIAGSGAASDGKYKGVAPGAELWNGKVCNSGGSCADSWILAGMEWAATSGADVINMSLGGTDTAAVDPMEEAVNRLTAQTGALFVIAAGNSGPSPRKVGSPGSADAALTVAAVDKSDKVADFSSRGPRVGDGAVKPDIAAPGVGIVAARAAGTGMGTPVNDRYIGANGTSMATPHVAGGAAILAQRHPDWTSTQLKAALMGSATPLQNAGAFEVGTGRLDVHRAVTQQLHTTTPSVSFGLVEYPYNVPPATKTVTYRNDGDGPVTVNLDVTATHHDGSPAPAGMFILAATMLTVQAGDTASTTVTMNPGQASTGIYGGRVTAAASDGQVVQAAVGVELEPESYDLTVNLLDRNGNTPTGPAYFLIHDYSTGFHEPFDDRYEHPSGTTLRLSANNRRYGVIAYIGTATPESEKSDLPFSVSGMVYPELNLTKEATLTMDGRKANKVTVAVDKPSARPYALTNIAAFEKSGVAPWDYVYLFHRAHQGTQAHDFYEGMSGPASDRFHHALMAQMTEPLVRLDVNGRDGFPVDVWYASSGNIQVELNTPRRPLLGTHRMGVVHGGTGTPEDLAGVDVTGKLVVLDLTQPLDRELVARVKNVQAAGGRAVLLNRSSQDFPIALGASATDLPVLLATDPQRSRLVELARYGGATVTTRGVRTTPYQYNLFLPTEDTVPVRPSYRPRDKDLGHVDATFRHTGAIRRSNYRVAWYSGRHHAHYWHVATIADPERRVEYYSPGPVHWVRRTSGSAGQLFNSVPQEYRPGRTYRLTESDAVMGPSFGTKPASQPPLCIPIPVVSHACRASWAYRHGDTMDVQLPLFTDHRPGGYSAPGIGVGYTRLYRDGQLVGERGVPGWATWAGAFTVPSGRAEYRLEVEAAMPSEWQHSTKVHAAWTFSSDTTAEAEALSLMAARYKPSLDDYNRGPAGKEVRFPVWVEHQNTTSQRRVAKLTVEASFDDGQTWRPVQLRRDRGDRWTATLTNPTSGFVTLRATATDNDGNTVNQTIKRAYSVK